MRFYQYLLFFAVLAKNLLAIDNPFSLKGQLWTSALTSNDIPDGLSSIESTLGYIPTFSLFKDLSINQLLDMEWAYRLDRTYSGDSLFYNNASHHRYWVRYSSEKLEARLGLQKIVFGPSFVLRSLSWFDTIDLKDPTRQTDGVEAFRLQWFPSNSLSLLSWAINNDQDTLSFGTDLNKVTRSFYAQYRAATALVPCDTTVMRVFTEKQLGKELRKLLPDIEISLSFEVLPIFREYERACLLYTSPSPRD